MLTHFAPRFPLAVAYSGGKDSTALLLGCVQKWGTENVVAIHVNHHLQEAALAFQRHCELWCTQRGILLHVVHTPGQHRRGDSTEAHARALRYAALSNTATTHKIAAIALAQHATDQIETVILALSRGSGIAGLAAMPENWRKFGTDYHRPFLRQSTQDIQTHAQKHWNMDKSDAIEDPSNCDTRFTRNAIRQHILPNLLAIFPQFAQTIGRSTAHCAQADELLTNVAQQDWQNGGFNLCNNTTKNVNNKIIGETISLEMPLSCLQKLSPIRQNNLLRCWLKQVHNTQASHAQLVQLLKQIKACRTRGHKIDLKVGDGKIQRIESNLIWFQVHKNLPQHTELPIE